MAKIIPISIVGVLVLSGFGIGAGEITSNPLIDSPYGPTEGYTDVNYTFYFIIPIELPNVSDFFIQWYWDDGIVSGWLGPYSGETIVNASHAWNATGNYNVRVILRDVWGATFQSDSWTIHISQGTVLKIHNISGFFWRIGTEISNVGPSNATNISWAIYTEKVTSPILFAKGTIPMLGPGMSENVSKIRPVFGLGWFRIIVKVRCITAPPIEKQADAFLFYFFLLYIKK